MNKTLTATVLTALVLTGCAGGTSADMSDPPSTPAADAFDDAVASARASAGPATPERTVPEPSDFALAVKVLTKQCFGSAGCNVTYRVDPTYSGPTLGDESYEVLYVVRGGSDGPVSDRFTVSGTRAEGLVEGFTSTASSSRRLTAKVTEVIPQ